jgi:hypothetical protein
MGAIRLEREAATDGHVVARDAVHSYTDTASVIVGARR